MDLPANISIAQARLPATYENAKSALASCASIDECQDWANKAEALASYARMADDDALRVLADRIQGRAVRRAGELLKTFNNQGARTDQLIEGAHKKSQGEVAREAGMSRHQAVTAVRVANVPTETFEREIESSVPPSVTKLAEMGRQHRAPPPPEGFREATHLIGAVRRFAEFCSNNQPETVASGVMPTETRELRELVGKIDGWLDRFVVNLKDVA